MSAMQPFLAECIVRKSGTLQVHYRNSHVAREAVNSFQSHFRIYVMAMESVPVDQCTAQRKLRCIL